MKQVFCCLIAFAFCLGPACAASEPATLRPERPLDAFTSSGKTLWRARIAAVVLPHVADVHSSWGKRELNSNLAGQTGVFGTRGALIKAGIVGGVCGVQYLVLRRHPSPTALYRKLAFINFADASVTGAVAIRNYGIQGR